MTTLEPDFQQQTPPYRVEIPKPGPLAVFLFRVAIPAVVIIITINLLGHIQEDTLQNKLNKALLSGNQQAALSVYQSLLQLDFSRIDYHRGLIRCRLTLAQRSGSAAAALLTALQREYQTFTWSGDLTAADIGWYGLGYLASLRNDYPTALEAFTKVQNRDLPYLNNSIGYVYLQLNDHPRAKTSLQREIDLNGFLTGAYDNLAHLLYQEKDFAALEHLLDNPAARPHLPHRIARITMLKTCRIADYLTDSLRMDHITLCGLLASAAVLALWFGYLRGLDVFEPEPLSALLLTLAMGMVLSMLCCILYDMYDFFIGLRPGGGLWTDLWYCIAGIGLIEETVKIIPFLLMVRFSKQVNESMDYIIYAGVSALGFAFMENLLYFQDPGLKSIVGRTFSSVPMHISLTVIAAYGLFYAKYTNRNKTRWVYFTLSFATACMLHGLYDFWLLAETLPPKFKFMSLVILVLCMDTLSKIIKNGLNQSEFNPDAKERIEHRTQYLVYYLSVVFLLQYSLLAWRWGADNANISIFQSSLFLYFPLLVVFGQLGNIEIQKGRWISLFSRHHY